MASHRGRPRGRGRHVRHPGDPPTTATTAPTSRSRPGQADTVNPSDRAGPKDSSGTASRRRTPGRAATRHATRYEQYGWPAWPYMALSFHEWAPTHKPSGRSRQHHGIASTRTRERQVRHAWLSDSRPRRCRAQAPLRCPRRSHGEGSDRPEGAGHGGGYGPASDACRSQNATGWKAGADHVVVGRPTSEREINRQDFDKGPVRYTLDRSVTLRQEKALWSADTARHEAGSEFAMSPLAGQYSRAGNGSRERLWRHPGWSSVTPMSLPCAGTAAGGSSERAPPCGSTIT